MAVTFTGDFSTGDFAQWQIIQNTFHNDPPPPPDTYAVAIASADPPPGATYYARFELRDGDTAAGSNERTEVQGPSYSSGGEEGDERWYQWSTRFDPTFPTDHATQGWGVVAQWHDQSGGSPPVGMYVDDADGEWCLRIQEQSSPGVFVDSHVLWSAPLDQGTWHTITVRIVWSTNSAVGLVELWYDGVRQTFTGGPDAGLQTTSIQTLTPTGGGTYFKQGIYRDVNVTGTAVIEHQGYTAATSEADLPTLETRRNLSTNPAAKHDLIGWYETGPAPATTRVTGLVGMDRTTGAEIGGTGTGDQYLIPAVGAATPASDYVVSAQYRRDGSTGTVPVYLLWLDASLTVLGSIEATPIATDGVPQRTYVTGTAPPNTASATVQVTLRDTTATLTVTAALVEAGTTQGAYFDGDSPGASWDGADGNSTSTLTLQSATGSLSATLPTLTATVTGTVDGGSAVTGTMSAILPALTASLTGQAGATEVVRRNLCDNPALDNNDTGWLTSYGTTSRKPATGIDRAWCWRLGPVTHSRGPQTPAVPGQTWTLSVWGRCETGTARTWLSVLHRSTTDGWLTDDGAVVTLTEDWRRFSHTVTITDADTAAIQVAAVNQDDTAYIELTKVLYEQTGTLGQYFDGDSPSCVWDGVAGNSTSSLVLAEGEPEPEPEFDPDAALKIAIAASDRHLMARLFVDWDRDGTYTHEVSDLSPWLTQVLIGRARTGDLPVEASLVEGSAAATLSATLGGIDPHTGTEPVGDGRSALEVFNPHRPDGPLWRTATVGTPLLCDVGVATDSGVRWLRQFTGTVRSLRPDSRGRQVGLSGIDPVDALRKAITLPAYGLNRSEVLSSGHGVLTINTQWVIDFCLRRNGIHASPPARDDAQIAATGHGSLAAEAGRNAVPRGVIGAELDAGESWWVPGPFGMLAARGVWQPPHGLYQEFFTRAAYRPVAGNGLGIGLWLRVGNDMDDVSGATSRPIIQLFPLVDHQAYWFQLWIIDSGRLGGSIVTDVDSFGFAETIETTTQWRYLGLHFQHNDDGTTRIRYRVDGTTTFGDVTTPPLTASFAQRMQMTMWQYRDWANMQVWFEFEPPAGDWPGERHSPQATLDVGVNELLALPDVVEEDAWTVIQEAAEAEYANCGFDPFGVFRFTNRDSVVTSPNTVEKEITADLDLLDLASEVNVDGVRNTVSVETTGTYLDFERSIVDSDDELRYQSPVGVWTYDVALEHGAIGTTTQTLPQLTTAEWQDQDPVWGFVAVQSANPEVEVTSGVTVTYVQVGDRQGQIQVRNYSTTPVRFATTTGSPALRVVGWSLLEDPAQTETFRSEGSIELYGERPYPIPASRWRQQPLPLRDVAGGLLGTLANPLPVIDGVSVRGDPTLDLGATVHLVDETGIGPGFRATVVKVDREHAGGLTDQLAVRPIVSPGLGLLDDTELGLLDSELVMAP